jgi:hypothetical protein
MLTPSCCVRLSLVAASLTALSCNGATQVFVDITTDMECSAQKGTTITVGLVSEIEDKPPAEVTNLCDEKELTFPRVGQTVLIPSGGRDEPFAIKVVMGVDIPAEKCTKDDGYAGCIVARRSLNFIPHSTLWLPIFLSGSCEGVGCTARPEETCVLGECVPAKVNPNTCTEEGKCDEGVLTSTQNEKPVAECGRPSVLVDTFDTDARSSIWETPSSPALAAQSAGALVLSLPDTGQEPAEVAYRSVNAVNLDDDAIQIQVPSMLNVKSKARAYLAAEYDATNKLVIEQQEGVLKFIRFLGSGTPVVTMAEYNPAKHRWWEIRGAGPNIVMRTSADGAIWDKEVVAFERPEFASAVNIVLGAASGSMVTGAGSVTFDNLNTGKPQAVWCAADTFSDSFEDDKPKLEWEVIGDPGCLVTQTDNNSVVFEASGPDYHACRYQSRTGFDLRGNAIVLNVGELTGLTEGTEISLVLTDDQNNVVEIGVGWDMGAPAFFHVNKLATALRKPNYHPPYNNTHKYIGIREDNGALIWQTSSDGTKWSPFPPEMSSFLPAAVHVSFGITSFIPMGSKFTASVVAYNPEVK